MIKSDLKHVTYTYNYIKLDSSDCVQSSLFYKSHKNNFHKNYAKLTVNKDLMPEK